MKKSLLIGILGGAAVGAAASYLLKSDDRRNLVSGIKNIGGKATDLYNDLLGAEEDASGITSGNSNRGRNQSSSSSSRRG